MQNSVGYGLLLPFVLFFGLLFPDFLTYGNLAVKANQIAENAVKMAERQGGFTNTDSPESVDLDSYIISELERNNLNTTAWEIDYTEGKVDYNQPLSITLKANYTMKAFVYLWGDKADDIKTVPIVANKSGIGQVYFR